MQNTAPQKLAKCETTLKRWHTRLVRASTMVAKLEKQRRRLQAQMGPVNLTDLIGPPLSAKDVGADQETVNPVIDVAEVRRQVDAAIDTTIPPQFKRDANVDALKAQRKSKEAPDKTKMPLTGRAALDAARPKRRA